MKNLKTKFDLKFIYLFIPLLLTEIIFHLIGFQSYDVSTLLRQIFFQLLLSLILNFIFTRFKSNKVLFVLDLIVVIFFSFYAFLELEFKNFMAAYYSVSAVSEGIGRVWQYAFLFITSAPLHYWLCLLAIPCFLILWKYLKFKNRGSSLVMIPCILLSAILLVSSIDLESKNVSILDTYLTFNNKELLINKLGFSHFLLRDIAALKYKAKEKITIDDIEINDPVIVDNGRKFDDSLWKKLAAEETNDNIKIIDNFLINRTITDTNEMTGVFKDYNFIYFLVESFDYLAIDKDLTPTLYKMYTQGYSYTNHYSVEYSCATGESEYVGLTSIYPYSDACTMFEVVDRNGDGYSLRDQYFAALPYLFKNAGYETISFHNWTDEFYPRTVLHDAYGFDAYYDFYDLKYDLGFETCNGWQSDNGMIDSAWQILANKNHFFSFIITSTMHFPYDESTYLGDKYLDEINQIHPDYPLTFKRYLSKSIEFDKALENLCSKLRDSGKLDNTIICMFSDHRPYWLSEDLMKEYTAQYVDRSHPYGIHKTPFIIYNPNLKATVNTDLCSNLDNLPTLANMFGLNYDPRLYVGNDLYSSDCYVIDSNRNWFNSDGIYYFTSDGSHFESDKEYRIEEIDSLNNYIQNLCKVSFLINDENYFEIRKAITNPKVVTDEH